MTMAENKMTKEVLKAAKGTGSVEELQKLAKENGMELHRQKKCMPDYTR